MLCWGARNMLIGKMSAPCLCTHAFNPTHVQSNTRALSLVWTRICAVVAESWVPRGHAKAPRPKRMHHHGVLWGSANDPRGTWLSPKRLPQGCGAVLAMATSRTNGFKQCQDIKIQDMKIQGSQDPKIRMDGKYHRAHGMFGTQSPLR